MKESDSELMSKLQKSVSLIRSQCSLQSDCSHCTKSECPIKVLESGCDQLQPQWVPVDFDIVDGKYSISGESLSQYSQSIVLNEYASVPYYDYVSGMNVLVKMYNLSYSSISFGGWFYNSSCSWHKSLVMKPDIPNRLRFWIYTCNEVQS